MKKVIQALLLGVMALSNGIVAMQDDDIEVALKALEQGVSSEDTEEETKRNDMLALQAQQQGVFRMSTKRRGLQKKDKEKESDLAFEGDEEFRDAGLIFDNEDGKMSLQQVAEVIHQKLVERAPGITQAQIIKLLREKRGHDLREYDALVGSITRGPGSDEILLRIAEEIRAHNKSSTKMAKRANNIAKKQLANTRAELATAQEALATQKNSASFYRRATWLGIPGSLLAGAVSTVVGILVTKYLKHADTMQEMCDLCMQTMQNSTMN